MRKFFVLLLLCALFLRAVPLVKADDAEDAQKADLQKKISDYQSKLNSIRQEKNTLSSQIQLMDTQIYLAGLRIQETEQNIQATQKEIELLSNRIEGLDSSLNYLSKLMVERIAEGYKMKTVSLFDMFLDSDNATDLFSNLKYYKNVQDNNQKILIQVQESKLNFEEQKALREKKKVDLSNLIADLNNQKEDLKNQQDAKRKLLADTQNSESVYQNLLQQAQAQLSSFKSFVQSSGFGSIIGANGFGNGSDGNYYSQRDSRWASNNLGYSSENILNVGCLLTSIAMFAKSLGQNVTPADLAADSSRFWSTTAWMRLPWPSVGGRSYQSLSVSSIDSELAAGNKVIVGVRIYSCEAGGNHYVLLTKKDGDDYIMHDPVYGPDLKFSSHYSSICSAATFK